MLRFIILGLLSFKPMTGYDLKTFFNKSVNFFWSAELSQIYRELSKLEKEGYINYRIEYQEGRPDKKIYSVTEEGERIFIEWLKDFPQNLTPVSRNEFLVRVFFSSKISNEDLLFHLKRFVRQKEDELNTYKLIEEKIKMQRKESDYDHKEELFHRNLTVRRGLIFAKAEIDWANECIEEIQNNQQQE